MTDAMGDGMTDVILGGADVITDAMGDGMTDVILGGGGRAWRVCLSGIMIFPCGHVRFFIVL